MSVYRKYSVATWTEIMGSAEELAVSEKIADTLDNLGNVGIELTQAEADDVDRTLEKLKGVELEEVELECPRCGAAWGE